MLSTALFLCSNWALVGGADGQRALTGAGLCCAGKLGNASSPRPAHHGAIIPRSSRRLDRTILDAGLIGGAAQSARTARCRMCQEPCTSGVVFLAGCSILLSAPGILHASRRPSSIPGILSIPRSPTTSHQSPVTKYQSALFSPLFPKKIR